MSDDDLARELAARARRGDARASALLAELFAERRDFDARRRKRIAETTYGLLRWGHVLEHAGGDLFALRAQLDDPSRRDEALAKLAWPTDSVERLALLGSMPTWVAARLIAERGDRAEPIAIASSSPPRTFLRANAPHQDGREALIAALAREQIVATALPRTTRGVVLADAAYDLFATRAHRDGLFEVQDEGSQLVAELVAPPPGSTIVDACAGEGGKTLAIAAALGGKGRIVACDIAPKKLEVLERRATRAGFSNIARVTLPREGEIPGPLRALLGKADRVLIDAPCSGIGTWRRKPEARYRIDEGVCTRLATEQLAIAKRFAPLVAPGGRLVYATCTILRDENEGVLEALREALGWAPMRAAEIWGTARAQPLCDPSGTVLSLDPATHGTDGFFAAVLRRPRA